MASFSEFLGFKKDHFVNETHKSGYSKVTFHQNWRKVLHYPALIVQNYIKRRAFK